MSRRAAIVFLTAFLGFLVVVTTAKAAALLLLGHGNLEPLHGDGHNRVVGKGQIRFDGAGPERWALRFRRERQLVERLRRRLTRQRYTIVHNSDVVEAIGLAATAYNVSESLMLEIARCESGFNPRARNLSSAATGVFQILVPSTWNTTPYARFSPLSPYANALAAAHMLAHGRRGEWVC